MSRSSSRRPTTNSRGSSSQGHRSLSVTEALQSIRLTETVGEDHGRPRRRASHWDEGIQYEEARYESTPYSSSYTLDPSVLTSSSTYGQHPYPDQPASTTNQYSGTAGTMRSYQSYSPPAISNPYRQISSSRSSSHYGYPNPRAEASMSRSMSGPSLPSVPPRTYEEIRNVGRDFVERRRHNVHRPRHQRKVIMRQALLPSTLRSSQAEDLSGSIDSFLAHSGSSYESTPAYVATSTYPGSTSRSIYDSTYTPTYPSENGPSLFTQSSRAYPAATAPTYGYNVPRRSSGNGTADPVVVETPSKPQCWDHGCNGRQFSTFSNLLRHQREKSGSSTKSVCHRCRAEFTRKTARDAHLAHDKCKQKSPAR